MLKLVTMLVLLVCTVIGARSCNASSPSSPFNSTNVVRNGVDGACANQQAVADASGDGGGGSAQASPFASMPASVQQELGALSGGSTSCPTTTTQAP